jgi:hypothetical protein
MQLSQPLSEIEQVRRRVFARDYGALPENILGAMNVTWSPDEAHFNLDNYISKAKLPILRLRETKTYRCYPNVSRQEIFLFYGMSRD